MVNRILTGAGYGLGSWLWQRITAVIMLIGSIIFFGFVAYWALNVNSNISSWQTVFSCMFVKIVVQIFFAAVLIHAWVGIRDLWMDYIQSTGIRLTLHTLTILWLVGSLIYSIKVIWVSA